jgi:hypothetical protein
MRRAGALLLVALALPAQPEERDALWDAEAQRLVWAAADAPEERFDEALGELRGFPGVSWRDVHDVLAAGRDYSEITVPGAPTQDLAELRAFMAKVPWRPGEVRVIDLGTTPQHWYQVELPGGYDGSRPLSVLLDLGGFSLSPGSAPPRDWAIVRMNDLLFHLPDLGGVPLSLTAGTASQTIVLSILADLERRVNVDRDRVHVAGFSRGGNATLYFAAHWPDLWAGAIAASGYYPVENDTWPNVRGVGILAARGDDRGHRGANDFMKRLGHLLEKADHPDVTEHVAEGRAVDGGLGGKVWTWMQARRREPLPDDVSYTLRDSRHRGAYWVEILQPKDTGGTRPVVIGRPGDTTAESFPVHRRPSRARARRTGPNAVEVEARNVARLRLLLSPAQFDLSQPLRLRTGGRTREVTITPTIGGLLRRFRRDRDRSRLFPAAVDVDL